MITWHINPRENGLPLLEAMALRLPSAPRAFLRQLCKKQRVTLDGSVAGPSLFVHTGMQLSLKPSERLSECIASAQLEPEQILFEDRDCLVLYKPAGMIIHPASGSDDDLLSRLKVFMRLRGESFQLAPIHRLDRCTSGPVMFGKGREAIRQLGQLFMDGKVQKHYLAMVEGNPPPEGVLLSPVPAHGKEKESITHYQKVCANQRISLLDLILETGRRHQIRRQLADAGWPLTGDSRYGLRQNEETGLPLLHCHKLQFPLLSTTESVVITCPLTKQQALMTDRYGLQLQGEFSPAEKPAPFALLRL